MNREILLLVKVMVRDIRKNRNLQEEENRKKIEELMKKAQKELEGQEIELYLKEVLNMLQQMKKNDLFDAGDLGDILFLFENKLKEFVEKYWDLDRYPKDKNGVVDVSGFNEKE